MDGSASRVRSVFVCNDEALFYACTLEAELIWNFMGLEACLSDEKVNIVQDFILQTNYTDFLLDFSSILDVGMANCRNLFEASIFCWNCMPIFGANHRTLDLPVLLLGSVYW
eukprot:c9108_g1_i1 orf=3-335(-)